jgi:hypothetical protein
MPLAVSYSFAVSATCEDVYACAVAVRVLPAFLSSLYTLSLPADSDTGAVTSLDAAGCALLVKCCV